MKLGDQEFSRAIGDIAFLMLGVTLLFAPAESSRPVAGFLIMISSLRLLVAWMDEKKEKSTHL